MSGTSCLLLSRAGLSMALTCFGPSQLTVNFSQQAAQASTDTLRSSPTREDCTKSVCLPISCGPCLFLNSERADNDSE